MSNCAANAKILANGLVRTGRFKILSKEVGVPLVAFSLKDSSKHDEYEISDHLRRFGWIVPAYTMAPDAQHVTLLRVVIREDFNRSLAERLVRDIEKVLRELDALPPKLVKDATASQVESHPQLKERKDIKAAILKSGHEFDEIASCRRAVKAWKNFVVQKTNRIC